MEFIMNYGAIIASILVAGILLVYKFYFSDKEGGGPDISFDIGSFFGKSDEVNVANAVECVDNVCKRGRPKKISSEM
jgi:hypothetical protein